MTSTEIRALIRPVIRLEIRVQFVEKIRQAARRPSKKRHIVARVPPLEYQRGKWAAVFVAHRRSVS